MTTLGKTAMSLETYNRASPQGRWFHPATSRLTNRAEVGDISAVRRGQDVDLGPGRLITIAVVGADGAGKTSVAKRAAEESSVPAAYLYMGFNPESHRFALPTSHLALWLKKRVLRRRLERTGPGEHETDFSDWGHVSMSENPVIQFLRLLNRLFESTVRTGIAYLMAAKGRVIVADRHFVLDFGLDRLLGRVEGNLSSRIYGWAVVSLFPRPNLVIYLEAPAETLYARKSEASPEYLENRQRKYREASSLFPAFEVVDATRPLPEVVADVVTLIDEFVRDRNARRGKD